MKLSRRIQTIFDLVPYGITADVGSDHGKLIISLFLEGKIKKGYAIENKKGPYDRLVKEITNSGVRENVIPVFSDGISELEEDVDTVVIAGMGGFLINNIINSHPEKLKNVRNIIVDAHNDIPGVRKNIISKGYFIKNEKMVFEDNIYYEIIAFEKGESKSLSEDELFFGPILLKDRDPLFRQKYLSILATIENTLKIDSLPINRKNELIKEKERIERVYEH